MLTHQLPLAAFAHQPEAGRGIPHYSMDQGYPPRPGHTQRAGVESTPRSGGTAYRFRAPHLGMGKRWPLSFLAAMWPAYAALGAGVLFLHCLKRGG